MITLVVLSVSTGQSKVFLEMNDVVPRYLISLQLRAVNSTLRDITIPTIWLHQVTAQSIGSGDYLRLPSTPWLGITAKPFKCRAVQRSPKFPWIWIGTRAFSGNQQTPSKNWQHSILRQRDSRLLFSFRSLRVHSPQRNDLFSLSHMVDDCISLSSVPPSASMQELREGSVGGQLRGHDVPAFALR